MTDRDSPLDPFEAGIRRLWAAVLETHVAEIKRQKRDRREAYQVEADVEVALELGQDRLLVLSLASHLDHWCARLLQTFFGHAEGIESDKMLRHGGPLGAPERRVSALEYFGLAASSFTKTVRHFYQVRNVAAHRTDFSFDVVPIQKEVRQLLDCHIRAAAANRLFGRQGDRWVPGWLIAQIFAMIGADLVAAVGSAAANQQRFEIDDCLSDRDLPCRVVLRDRHLIDQWVRARDEHEA
jgi:hypothetical protein